MQALETATYEVKDIKKGERIRRAPLPFTTRIPCRQEAAKVLNFGTQKTMRIAQQVYEGIDVKGSGTIRCDHLSAYGFYSNFPEEADAAARAYIAETYGAEYAAAGEQNKKTEKKIPGCS